MMVGERWQPIGGQFPFACMVCENRDSLECRDCRCEKKTGFVFSPHLYVKAFQKFAEDKYFFDGKNLHHITGKTFSEMEEKLKKAEEERDYWKRLADKALQEVVNMAYKVVDSAKRK